jgi:hypothetical protein
VSNLEQQIDFSLYKVRLRKVKTQHDVIVLWIYETTHSSDPNANTLIWPAATATWPAAARDAPQGMQNKMHQKLVQRCTILHELSFDGVLFIHSDRRCTFQRTRVTTCSTW